MGKRRGESVLRSQISYRQFAQYDFGSRSVQCLHLVVDDLPLGVHDGLVFGHLVHPHLRIVLLALEFQLHVEAHNLRVLEDLRLLFEPRVRECLLECHPVDEEGILQRTACDLLDANQLLAEIVLIE